MKNFKVLFAVLMMFLSAYPILFGQVTLNHNNCLHSNSVISSAIATKVDFIDMPVVINEGEYESVLIKIQIETNATIDSVIITGADYCSFTNMNLKLFDNGQGNDLVADDGIYTAQEEACLNLEMSIPNGEDYIRSGATHQLYIYYSNDTFDRFKFVTAQYYVNSTYLESLNSIPIYQLTDSIQYSENIINIVSTRSIKETTLDFNSIDLFSMVNDNFTNFEDFPILIYFSPRDLQRYNYGISGTYSPDSDIIRLYGGLSHSTIQHEITHNWINFELNYNMPSNSGHWGFIETESSGFGNGCYNGTFDSLYINNEGQLSYLKSNEELDNKLNDFELFLMGAMEIDDVPWPIKFVSGDSIQEGCNSSGTFDHGELGFYTKNDFLNFESSSLEEIPNLGDTIYFKAIVISTTKLDSIELRMYNEVIEEYEQYFEVRGNGLIHANTNIKKLGVDNDNDGFLSEEDCNDMNANINPGEIETPYNGIDDDCDPTTLDDDLDQDGFVLTEDCDDTNFDINPNAIEIPNNGIDEDCDGDDLMTSVHEIGLARINIYPNPVREIININIDRTFEYVAELYNIEGKRVYSEQNSKTIDVSQLPQGAYSLQLTKSETGQRVTELILVTN